MIVTRPPHSVVRKLLMSALGIAGAVFVIFTKLNGGFATLDAALIALLFFGLIFSMLLHVFIQAALPDEIEVHIAGELTGIVSQKRGVLQMSKVVVGLFITLILVEVLL
ncbi:MAG: hypothetical protein AAGF50_02010 [Pseudomonadota bacterium]